MKFNMKYEQLIGTDEDGFIYRLKEIFWWESELNASGQQQ